MAGGSVASKLLGQGGRHLIAPLRILARDHRRHQRKFGRTVAGAVAHDDGRGGRLDQVAKGVKRGEGVAVPLKRTGQFPALAGHLLTVGEETGHLDMMFERMADIYDKDTREAIKRFTALFEPIVILALGVVVGAMILSVLLAITSINQLAM